MDYEFFAPPQILFGWGRRREVGALAASLGRRTFVVNGSKTLEQNGALAELLKNVRSSGVEAVHIVSISREPEVGDVDELSAKLVSENVRDGDSIIGIGGGSAVDLAKAGAAMATNRKSNTVADYLEGVGHGLKIQNAPLPVLAIPTTAGTGSEATKNAVISSSDPPFKKSLRSNQMVPRIVLIDPELTTSASPEVTVHSGMDAITQLIESFISRRAKPIPRALCIQGLQLAIPALPVAVRKGDDRAAREAMAHAALLSGMALANSGLGLAHGVAAALGSVCQIRHGLACAVMLPAAIEINRAVSEEDLAILGRTVCAAKKRADLTSDSAATEAFINCIRQLGREIGVPIRLGELGVRPDQIPALTAGSRGNSMAGNPREVSDLELAQVLRSML